VAGVLAGRVDGVVILGCVVVLEGGIAVVSVGVRVSVMLFFCGRCVVAHGYS
jgi:hypothetical protein